MTNQEDIKFWEKFGLTHKFGGMWWYDRGKGTNSWYEMPNGVKFLEPPPFTLDNMFKFCIPIVLQYYKDKSSPGYYCSPCVFWENWTDEVTSGVDPAIALKKAIEEVING